VNAKCRKRCETLEIAFKYLFVLQQEELETEEKNKEKKK
jgi:hypothetical protein